MKRPHIKIVDGLWCLYPHPTARRPVIVCNQLLRLYARAKKRHAEAVKRAQDRETVRLARQRDKDRPVLR